jgi:glutathione S-transferase
MKLFYTPGACSLSTHIVLRELDLPFTLEAVDLKTKRTATGADFTAINPKGYVPALRLEDGEVLTEGAAIVQHLVDKHAPGTLAPAPGTVERARVNGHLNFLSAELHKACGPLFNPAITAEARAAAVANCDRKLDLVEKMFADGRPYISGSEFTVADPYLFVILSWIPAFGIDLAGWPLLDAFARRLAARGTVRAAMAAEGLPTAA